MEKKKKKDRES